MHTRPLRVVLALAGATGFVAGPLVLPAAASPAPVEVQVLGFSDFHGRLEPVDETDAGAPVGGAVQLAAAVEQYVEANENTVVAASGDNIGASTFTSNVQDDEPTIEALNALGLQVSAVGNHEFDRGFEDLTGRVDDLADFPYLGANVYAEGSQDPLLDASLVLPTPSGVDVGFVGVVTQETASLVNPAGIEGLEFGEEAVAANREAALLRDGDEANGEADVVVLLLHDGSEGGDCAADQTLQALTDDIDAVVAGHTHEPYECDPFTGGAGFSGPVVQAGEYGQALDVLTFTVAGREVTAAAAEIVPLTGFAEEGDRVEATRKVVADAVAFAEEVGGEVIGSITTDITRALDDQGAENRGAESVLGNFIADVQLAQTQEAGAQIALMNPGGLRDDFLVDDISGDEAPGEVTLAEANAVQPFANALVTMTLTGAQVEAVLEEQWQPAGSSRPFLALGLSDGFFYTYLPDNPVGERITSVTLDGAPLDPEAAYRVTVNEFLAAGGDNFTTLAQGTDRQQLGQTDLEALAAYFAENSPVTPDTASRRAVGAGEAPAPTPTSTPSAPAPAPSAPAPVRGGVNPGLSVDTGVEDRGAGLLGPAALGTGLAAAAAAAAGVAALRRRARAGR